MLGNNLIQVVGKHTPQLDVGISCAFPPSKQDELFWNRHSSYRDGYTSWKYSVPESSICIMVFPITAVTAPVFSLSLTTVSTVSTGNERLCLIIPILLCGPQAKTADGNRFAGLQGQSKTPKVSDIIFAESSEPLPHQCHKHYKHLHDWLRESLMTQAHLYMSEHCGLWQALSAWTGMGGGGGSAMTVI